MVRYKLNLSRFKKMAREARDEFLKEVIEDTKEYVPNSGGRLERSVRIAGGSRGKITYNTPYARYLWHGKLMLAPNASSWAKAGEKKHVTDIDLKYNQAINRKAGAYWVLRSKRDNLEKWKRSIVKKLNER